MNYLIDHSDLRKWNEGLEHAETGAIVEMTEESYYYFLNCLPPILIDGPAFIVGEPWKHNEKGKPVYLCCLKRNGKYYCEYGTVADFRERKIFRGLYR